VKVSELLKIMKKSKNVIDHDKFDIREYSRIYEKSPRMKEIEQQGLKSYNGFDSLLQDAFYSLYKIAPELKPIESVAPGYEFSYEMIKTFLETNKYKEMYLISKLNELNSAIGAIGFAHELIQQMKSKPELNSALQAVNAAIKANQKAEELQAKIESLNNLIETLKSQGGKADKYEKQLHKAQLSLQEAQELARQQANKCLEQIRANQSTFRQVVYRAAEKSSAEVFETSDMLDAWGVGGGDFQKLPIEQKFELAQILKQSKKLKNMLNLVGKFRNLAKVQQKTKLKQKQPEIHGIEIGRDIPRILPAEMVMAGREETKPLFYKKFLSRGFLQYSLKGREKVGKGPIVVLIDVSASTKGSVEEYEKALALGLKEIASIQRRAFAAVFFSDGDDLKTIEFSPKEFEPQKVIELAEYFEGGGTDFEKPLLKGMEILQKSEYKNGDLVLITDGECAVSPEFQAEFLKVKKARGFKVFSIVIDLNGKCSTDGVKPFSDWVYTLSELTQDVAELLFAAV